MRIARTCVFCKHASLHTSPAVLMPFVAHRALGYAPTEITAEWGLRDLPQGPLQHRCNTCYCPQCQGLFLDQRFDNVEMQSLYAGYRETEYTTLRDHYEPGYTQRNNTLQATSHVAAVEALLAPYLPARPRVLDWGGDDGHNTPFRLSSEQCDVLDISGKTPIPGVNAITPDQVQPSTYDLIVLSQILEHIPEPADLMTSVRAATGPHTKVYLEVPYESLMQQLQTASHAQTVAAQKRHWHEHINFYSPQALTALVEPLGLVPLTMGTRVDSPTSTILYLLCQPKH